MKQLSALHIDYIELAVFGLFFVRRVTWQPRDIHTTKAHEDRSRSFNKNREINYIVSNRDCPGSKEAMCAHEVWVHG